MFKLCKKSIEIAEKHRVDFGDIRIVEKRKQELSVKNGEVGDFDLGIAIPGDNFFFFWAEDN